MSGSKCIIQQLDLSNYPLLVPLMKDCFAMDVTADYFKWKYFDNPAGTCVGFMAIEKDTNQAVAFFGAMPQKYVLDGKEIKIFQGCDFMTHSQHRKKSLFPVLAKECYDYLKDRQNFFMISIGGTPRSLPVLKYFGWRILFKFKNYFKPNIFCRPYILKKYPANSFVTENSLDPLEELITDQPRLSKIKSPRNLEHYKWRISNPNYNYKIVSYRKADTKRGFVVYFVQNNKILLFDFVFKDADSKKALLWYLSKEVVKNKYKGIVSFCQENGFESHLLKRNFFISNPFKKGPLSDKPPFLIYSDEETMEKFSSRDKWALTAYDYDAL
ncbi:MAG TPA: GNAT family N-acetyltransferase [Chitinophagaceae bacterium]|nr:GNAT family N-acetyltransferase [Chitinophagaceae bacterium]